jgi:RHS repeat-associated protein
VDVAAALRTPIQSDEGNKRSSYVLRWELRNKLTGQWLSEVHGIGSLDQNVVVEDPTSDQLGLEAFYQYTAVPTGAGSAAYVNTHAGNAVYEYGPIANPGRGLATFARMAYNSQDTSSSSMGFGWSMAGSTISRLGSPLEFHPKGQDWPTDVTLVDGDGTSHFFTLDKHGSSDPADWEYASPAGVHLFLQRNQAAGDPMRAWVMTKPDRTQFFFDTDGYPSAVVDKNGNTQTFTYAERRSANQPTKFLQYVTDPAGRQTLTLDYYQKGDDYQFIDDAGDLVSDTNLTNPFIIDQVRSITDVDGRRIELTYTDKGLMARLVDGAGTSVAKTFRYAYDALQGNKNVKLVGVTDPRGNTTDLAYYNPPPEPKFHWWAQSITARDGGTSTFTYVDPDNQAGSVIETTVTDPEAHVTGHVTDGFGRPTAVTDALGEVTNLTWDADNNVVELTEANGAVNTWTYDQDTGYPLTIRDPEANANGTPATVLIYQTGLGGHIADLVGKTSPEGRSWSFDYDLVGNLVAVTDPAGIATGDPDDFTTRYTYDGFGQLLTTTDANGNETTNSDYHPTGLPETITDALNGTVESTFDPRGNPTSVTDQLGKTSTVSYDLFNRPLETVQPLNQDAGELITTPAPVYDPNDNVVVSAAPNGATTSVSFDPMDRPVQTTLPENMPEGPERIQTVTYDRAGNVLTETDPKGNLTPADSDDFVTRFAYDAANQLTTVTDAAGNQTGHAYDAVGNLVAQTDPRGNTASFAFDRNGRQVQQTDPSGAGVTSGYDLDGLVTATVDQVGARTETDYDQRGMVSEVRVPHSTGVTRVTRYEYDQVGNTVKVTSPRGVATTGDPDDFAQQTVYDPLNRPVEQILPYDPDDPVHNSPDSIIYRYDAAGRTTTVSAPPSAGQTVRNETATEYLDTGWVESTTDPWGIVASYDYNLLGQQTGRTLTSAGGSSGRTMTWDHLPDGSLAARSDDGVPAGLHVVVVDNSDVQNTTVEGVWPRADSAGELFGFDYATNAAGTGQDSFTWQLNIPAVGTYEVFARWPQVSGAATDAAYAIDHDGGVDSVAADQSQRAGEWVSLGSFGFVEGNQSSISLTDDAGGTVLADAVKLVRDTSGETDTEAKSFTYTYDANGNQVEITDSSADAVVDSYRLTFDGLNRVSQVDEVVAGTVANTTGYTYDPNGNPLTRSHDRQDSSFAYDERNLLSEATVTEPGVAPKVTSFTYTPRGQRASQTSGNGNTIEYGYHQDGQLHSQIETRSDGTLVASHDVGYDLNGNRSRTDVQVQNADDPAAYLEHVYSYAYDPRDRIAQVTKTPVGGVATTEEYVHDANDNVVSSTIGGVTTSSTYDRNRLQTTSTGEVSTASNYDPFGRLDTLTVAGQVVQRYRYDGFDRIAEQQSLGTETSTTRFGYDPLDRTIERIDDAGTAEAESTSYEYLGTSGEVAAELVDGTLDRTYQYGPGGLRLSMQTHDTAGVPDEASYYSYNPHADVVAITDEVGNTRATYGYTAYGKPDTDLFTGVDAPDPGNPDAEPYNIYRFNAMRVDAATGNYDMGFRNYSPQEGRFLSRDMYNGALSDLGMTSSPWTQNRYAFGAGNPISRIENNGHCWGFLSSACDAVGGAVSDAWDATTDWWTDTAQPWLEENIVEPVQEAAEDAAEAVGDAAEATVDFVEEHKAEIAGIVAGIAVTAGCLVATGGAGSIGCAALGGAVGAGLTGYMNGQRGWELVGTVAIGAAAGALGGAIGGRVAGALASRLGSAGASTAGKAAPLVAAQPNRILSARVLLREAAEPGPFHNFPGSFDDVIYNQGTRTVVRNFFNKLRPLMSNDSIQYRLPGSINNRPGTFEIFTRPSLSGRTEVVQHRFFRPGS